MFSDLVKKVCFSLESLIIFVSLDYFHIFRYSVNTELSTEYLKSIQFSIQFICFICGHYTIRYSPTEKLWYSLFNSVFIDKNFEVFGIQLSIHYL